MSKIYSIINNRLVTEDEALVNVMDLSIQRGYGIFDYFKILDGNPVFLDDHLSRFYGSAKQMRLDVPLSAGELKSRIFELIDLNKIPISGIKLTLTGGDSADGFAMGKPNLFITQSPLSSYRDTHDNGIRLMTWPYLRQMPGVKTIDYLMAVWLQPMLKEKNMNDVLYMNGDIVTECPRANIFIVTHDDKILTPGINVLAGITRSKILLMTDQFDIVQTNITRKDLLGAREVFITSSTKNVLPVVAIDDTVFNNGIPGELTKRISQKLVTRIHASSKQNPALI